MLESLKRHRLAHELSRCGTYWNGERGCAVGCTLVDFDRKAAINGQHEAYERLFGIPAAIARIEDGIFEQLDGYTPLGWPERFVRAIAPGSDLRRVFRNWALWVLRQADSPMPQMRNQRGTRLVARMYAQALDGRLPRPTNGKTGISGCASAAQRRSQRKPASRTKRTRHECSCRRSSPERRSPRPRPTG